MLSNIDRYIVGRMRARYVNPTPADLGGVTSFLYELEHSAKPSLPGTDKYVLLIVT